MLILTRSIGQTIRIIEPDGAEIEVAVLGMKGNQVRLGIEAPDDVPIYREEVYQRILKEKGKGAA